MSRKRQKARKLSEGQKRTVRRYGEIYVLLKEKPTMTNLQLSAKLKIPVNTLNKQAFEVRQSLGLNGYANCHAGDNQTVNDTIDFNRVLKTRQLMNGSAESIQKLVDLARESGTTVDGLLSEYEEVANAWGG